MLRKAQRMKTTENTAEIGPSKQVDGCIFFSGKHNVVKLQYILYLISYHLMSVSVLSRCTILSDYLS